MISNEIKLSVCITTFNMELYIGKALDSILQQKVHFIYEIVISDDCSSDQTLNIIRNYQEKHGSKIVLLQSPINTGVLLNLKRAIIAAKGKYIALLDADDYWVNNHKLQKQFNILENNQNIGFVYTNFKYINEEGIIGNTGIKSNFVPPKKGEYIPYLLNPYISPSCICFQKDILSLRHFDTISSSRYSSQEYAIFLGFTARECGFYLDEVTMHYLVRKESLSRKSNYKEKIKTFYSSFETANEFIKTHPIPAGINNKRIFNFYFKILLTSWESMSFDIIKRFTTKLHLIDFFRYNPKGAYIYIASHNKILYQVLRPWVLRKRPPGK